MRPWFALVLLLPLSSAGQTRYDWIQQVGSGSDNFTGLAADAQGNTYVVGFTQSTNLPMQSPIQAANAGGRDLFVVKLDRSGNVVYSTYFGGSADDTAAAMTADASGNVYITGMTLSPDFPVTQGSYQTTAPAVPVTGQRGWSFVVKLNPTGGLAFSTYFTSSTNNPGSIAVGPDGSVYIAGNTSGNLPVTPGAYSSTCNCGVISNGFFGVMYDDGFLARFSPAGDKLIFATYLGAPAGYGMNTGSALAVASDNSAYVGYTSAIDRYDPTGSTRLAHFLPNVQVSDIAMAPDGSIYVAGLAADGFQPTAGAIQSTPNLLPTLGYQPQIESQQTIANVDANLQSVLSSTYLGGGYGAGILSMDVAPSGELFVGGGTSPRGWPTVAPLAQGFGSPGTGFAGRLSGDLTSVDFSSYFGDNENFSLYSVASAPDSSLILAGLTYAYNVSPATGAIWVNRVSIAPPAPLHIDSVVNAASRLADPLSGGETISVRGSGFRADAQIVIGGQSIAPLSVTANEIVAVLPATLLSAAAGVQVASGGATSNSILTPIATASPGLFSTDGTGVGQGYILNQDGTLNSAANATHPGDRITVFATGVGPVSFDNGYAVTATPVSLYVYDFYCNGVAAVMGPVAGFPGSVYQLTVYVPPYSDIVAINPDLKNFQYPPQVGVILRIAGGQSQNGLALSIAP